MLLLIMRYIINTFGKMKLVTLKEFLKEVPVNILDHQYTYHGFYARFRPRRGIGESINSPTTLLEYKSVMLPLLMGDIKIILKEHLIKQADHDVAFGGVPVSDLFWYICGKNAKAGGSPTHLVRVSRRVWLAANNKEFLIVKNSNGIGLVCQQPMRTCLTSVFTNHPRKS